MLFDYIFLDLDGPILEGKNRHYRCYKDILTKFGGSALDADLYWDLKRSKVTRDVVLKKSCFQASYGQFYNSWMQNIEDPEYLKLDTLKPRVKETLERWKHLTNKLILITMRQNRKYLIAQLQDFKVHFLFDEIIDCPPQRKNTKYVALKNKKFDRAIMIGDTEEDTKTAKMLNIKSIGITDGLRKKEYLDADYYYKNIKDIDFLNLGVK